MLYARTDVGGAFKSTDGGSSWHFISQYALSVGGVIEKIFYTENSIEIWFYI